jgi:hypothetical protein
VFNDGYPRGAFAYTQLNENVISFNKPVEFVQVFLKSHRSPHYYLKNNQVMSYVTGYLREEVVLNATIIA